jgi:hypothetical protein
VYSILLDHPTYPPSLSPLSLILVVVVVIAVFFIVVAIVEPRKGHRVKTSKVVVSVIFNIVTSIGLKDTQDEIGGGGGGGRM